MKISSFWQRALVVVILLPIGLWMIYLGGWPFTALVAFFGVTASYEFCRLFEKGGYKPNLVIVMGGALLLLVARQYNGFTWADWMISLFVLAAITYHLFAFERGRDQAAVDFAITLGGLFYLGWIGSYFVSLRNVPDGLYWILITLFSVWFADSGAYFVGSRFGRHKMSPRLSPKKSWEGYFGGILFGVLGAMLIAFGMQQIDPGSAVTIGRAAFFGLVMGIFPTLGDLGESMIKRQFNVKDSGAIFPGHGGAFDRIDSWLWAVVIGYYLVTWLY